MADPMNICHSQLEFLCHFREQSPLGWQIVHYIICVLSICWLVVLEKGVSAVWSELVGWNSIWPPNDEYLAFQEPLPSSGLLLKSLVSLPATIYLFAINIDRSTVLSSTFARRKLWHHCRKLWYLSQVGGGRRYIARAIFWMYWIAFSFWSYCMHMTILWFLY